MQQQCLPALPLHTKNNLTIFTKRFQKTLELICKIFSVFMHPQLWIKLLLLDILTNLRLYKELATTTPHTLKYDMNTNLSNHFIWQISVYFFKWYRSLWLSLWKTFENPGFDLVKIFLYMAGIQEYTGWTSIPPEIIRKRKIRIFLYSIYIRQYADQINPCIHEFFTLYMFLLLSLNLPKRSALKSMNELFILFIVFIFSFDILLIDFSVWRVFVFSCAISFSKSLFLFLISKTSNLSHLSFS